MRRKVFFALTLLVLVGSLLGCGGPPAASPESAPMARYMPADTPLFLSMQLRPEEKTVQNWRRIRDAFAEIPAVKEGLDEMGAELQEGLPFDWKEDVEPWMGATMGIGIVDLSPLWDMGLGVQATFDNITEALESGAAPSPAEPSMPETVPVLIAIEVQDPEALARFIDSLRKEFDQISSSILDTSYGDATIYTVGTRGEEVSFAFRENQVLLMSPDIALVEAALDRGEADSLYASADFQAVVERLPAGGLMLGYAAARQLMQEMSQLLGSLGGAILPTAEMDISRAAGFTLMADPNGLRLEAVTIIDPAAVAEAGLSEYYEKMRQPHPGHSLQLMPKETVLTFTGRDLYSVWDMFAQQLQAMDPEAYQDLQGGLEDLAIEIGLDLEEDVLSWMTGEFALYLAPGEELGDYTLAGIPAFRMGLLIEATDRAKVEQTMQKVEALIEEEADLSFNTYEIEGVEARVISMLGMSGYLPGYAFVDDFLVIAIDKDSFAATIRASKSKGERLAASSEFRTVSDVLPEKNTGIFFLDIQGLTDYIEAYLPEPERSDFRNDVRPFLDLLGGMGVAESYGEDYSTMTIFLHIVRE